jgi:hypothetical protein
MKRLVACALLLSACTSHKIVVMGGVVHAHLGELRRTGQAEVAVGAEDGDRAYDGAEVIRIDQAVTVGGKRRQIDDLAYRCEDQPPPADTPIPDDNQCELLARREDPFLLRTDRKFVGFGAIGVGVLAGVVVTSFFGTLACAVGCDSPYQELSIVGLSGLVIAAFVSCSRRSGCHD